MRGEEGGQYYISQTCDQKRFEARKVVFRGSVSTVLQLVVAVPFLAMGKKKLYENYARNDELFQK